MNFVLFLGILLVLGLLSTRIVKLIKLPNVTGFLVIGLIAAILSIIIDKCTNSSLLTYELSELNEIVSMIALGFIALSIGEEFKLSKIKEYGSKIITITFFQAIAAVLFVDIALVVVCIIFKLDMSIAIILGAIATATAPAATLMVIHQYNAKGPLVDILLPVVAFDDAIGLVIFSISVSIGEVIATGAAISIFSILILPLIEIIGSLLIGFVLGYLMHFLIKFFKSRNNHNIVIIAFTLLGVGLCELAGTISINGNKLELSNLLTCMMIGAVYVNIAKQSEMEIVTRDKDLIDRWTPFLFMLFFVLSGSHLATSAYSIFSTNTDKVLPLIIVFVVYIIFRSSGKYLGARLGSKITKQPKNIVDYLGLTLLPQAGVAIGMANQISSMESFKTTGIGSMIVTCVLLATLLYEIVGPLITKWSLVKTGEITEE